MSIHVNYGSTLGALLVGFGFSSVIFGILSLQAFSYFRRFPNDLPAYKSLVALVWAMEFVDQLLIGHAAYVYIISDYGDMLSIITNKIIWSLLAQIVLTSCVGVIVKTCFAMRVWRFSGRNIFVTGTILALAFTTFCVAIVFAIKSALLPSILLLDQTKLYGTVALATGVTTDVVTASSLCYFLHRLRTGYKKYVVAPLYRQAQLFSKRSDSLINTLTIYAVNTGGLTSAISLTTLLLYNLRPHAFYFMASFFCLSKVYAISLLCTLNTRSAARGRGTDRNGCTTSNIHKVHGATFILVNNHLRSSFHALERESKILDTEVGAHQGIAVVDVDESGV
jgi:hypothetical protein